MEATEQQPGVIETRMKHVEDDVDHMRADIRELRRTTNTHFLWLVSLQLGSTAALLGVMAKGFGWLS